MFIEGLTKDKNISIRCNSASGLARIGVTTFRTLLVGLYDDNPNVRKTIENEMLQRFKIEDIVAEFFKRIPQLESLKFTLRDILEKRIPLSRNTSNFLENLLHSIEYQEQEERKMQEYNSNISNNYYRDNNEELFIENPQDENFSNTNNVRASHEDKEDIYTTKKRLIDDDERYIGKTSNKQYEKYSDSNNYKNAITKEVKFTPSYQISEDIYNTANYPEFKNKLETKYYKDNSGYNDFRNYNQYEASYEV